MHKRLLIEDMITLKGAPEIATGMEAVSKDAQTLQYSQSVVVVKPTCEQANRL